MNRICTLLFIFFSIITSTIAQHLPDSWHISPDGRRLIAGNKPSEGFYDETVIPKVELNFAQADYWTQMTNNYAAKRDIPANLIYNGRTYPNVGVRFRGNTSYQRAGEKKSFSITMDFQDTTQDINGYETLHFNNAFEDASFMREVMYLNFIRRHIPAAKGSFVDLYINGQYWGLYPNIQVLNSEFIREWYLSDDGTRWRAERIPGGGSPGPGAFGAGTSTLNYLGTTPNLYKPHYSLKKTSKTEPWQDLINAVTALNTPAEDNLKKVFNTDRALWFVASEIMFGDDDSYVNKGGMDYYVYWDKETGRLEPIEYDGNSAFNTIASSWSPFLKETNAQFPIMNKLFAVPALRQRYLAHVRTMVEESLDEAFFNNKIDTYFNLIDSKVKADPKKPTTYDAFVTQRTNLKTWLRNRKTFYTNNAEVNRAYPSVSNVIFKGKTADFSTPDANQKVTVTANISFQAGIKTVNLYYGTGLDGYFDKILMYDDGNYNDGAANDGKYGGEIPAFAKGTYVRYYIEAVANDQWNTVAYMPKGAEHDVYFYQVNAGQSSNTSIAINEIMADNATIAKDPSGQYDDWVELYNKTNAEVDISGWFLSDDSNNRGKYTFPLGTKIAANGYQIIWADEDGKQTGLHANFKLSASGEAVYLYDKDTLQVDGITFTAQKPDVSFARKPNGTGNFGYFSPTFNANNNTAVSSTFDIEEKAILIYPNPANTEGVTIEVPFNQTTKVQVYTLLGQMIHSRIMDGKTQINTAAWQRGVYIVKIGNVSKKLVIE
jgi:hypothetical protein